jgi:DNA gyrase subunit A
MGVKTITMTDRKGGVTAALIVREHQDLVFISQNGMVQRTSVKGISQYGRASQGVRVMNIRDDDTVSAVAVVVEDSPDTAAEVAEELPSVDAGETTTQPADLDVSGSSDAPTGEAPETDETDGDQPSE